jgi:hypothetical protein
MPFSVTSSFINLLNNNTTDYDSKSQTYENFKTQIDRVKENSNSNSNLSEKSRKKQKHNNSDLDTITSGFRIPAEECSLNITNNQFNSEYSYKHKEDLFKKIKNYQSSSNHTVSLIERKNLVDSPSIAEPK